MHETRTYGTSLYFLKPVQYFLKGIRCAADTFDPQFTDYYQLTSVIPISFCVGDQFNQVRTIQTASSVLVYARWKRCSRGYGDRHVFRSPSTTTSLLIRGLCLNFWPLSRRTMPRGQICVNLSVFGSKVVDLIRCSFSSSCRSHGKRKISQGCSLGQYLWPQIPSGLKGSDPLIKG